MENSDPGSVTLTMFLSTVSLKPPAYFLDITSTIIISPAMCSLFFMWLATRHSVLVKSYIIIVSYNVLNT